jgi:Cu2+-exporting ATPase
LKASVAALERKSNHPIGRALADVLGGGEGLQVEGLVERNDGGVSGTVGGARLRVGSPAYMRRGDVEIPDVFSAEACDLESAGATAVMIAAGDKVVALAGLGDEIRPDAAEAVSALRAVGWRPEILSGDAQGVVSKVAHAVGVDTGLAIGQLSPEEKLARARHENSTDHCPIALVGDGVNDAAALAAADVGIAVRGGAEALLAAADVYIARPGLTPLVELVETSRHTMRVIRRNLLVSLAYNLLAGALAAAGVMSPLIAAVIMPLSSATVLSLVVLSVGRTRTTQPEASVPRWK